MNNENLLKITGIGVVLVIASVLIFHYWIVVTGILAFLGLIVLIRQVIRW